MSDAPKRMPRPGWSDDPAPPTGRWVSRVRVGILMIRAVALLVFIGAGAFGIDRVTRGSSDPPLRPLSGDLPSTPADQQFAVDSVAVQELLKQGKPADAVRFIERIRAETHRPRALEEEYLIAKAKLAEAKTAGP
jgi:hypothetical protein